MDALRKADAAGNVEDAQKLASIATRLKTQTPEPEVNPSESGSFIGQGMLGPINKAVDMTYSVTKNIPGAYKGDEPFMGTKWSEKNLGIADRPAKTLAEHAKRGVGEVMTLALPTGIVLKAVTKGTGLASTIAKTIYESMIKHPALTAVSEVAAGAGAGAGRGVGEQQEMSPGGKIATEMAGGVVGGLTPTALVHAPSALAYRAGKATLQKISLPFSKAGAKYRAGAFLKEKVIDPEKTIAKLGEGTLGGLPPPVATGEKRLITLYKSLVNKNPVTDAESIENISKSIIKLESEMKRMGKGSSDILADVTQKRVAALELRLDNRIMVAMERAQKKFDSLSIANRKVDESIIVRNELEGVMRQEHAKTKELWNAVSKKHPVGVEKTRSAYNALYDDLSNAQKTDIPAVLTKDPIITDGKLTITNAKEMQGLRSKLGEIERRARKNGQWNKARIANEVSEAILEDMGISARVASTPESADLLAAINATSNFKTRFEQGVVGKILGYSKTGAPTFDPSLTLDISLGRMKQRGAVDINKVVVTPEAEKATQRYLTRSYTDYATEKATGAINPTKSAQWIKNNESILDNFPELRTQLSDASEAQKVANETRAIMESRKKALRNPKISVAEKFLNAVDVGREVDMVLKAHNPVRIADDLVRKAGKDSTGEALEGLRGSFIDSILEKSSIGSFNELGEQTLSGNVMRNFVHKNEMVLKRVFTPEQVARMKTIGSELSKIEALERASVSGAELEMKDFASNALRMWSRIAGARLGGKMGKDSAGGSLQMAQIFSSRAKTFMDWLTKNRAEVLIHDAILSKDPELLKSLLLPIDKPSGQGLKNLAILNKNLNIWLGGTGARVMDDIMKEIKDIKTTED